MERSRRPPFGTVLSLAIIGATIFVVTGNSCASKLAKGNSGVRESNSAGTGDAVPQRDPDPGINLNCVYERLKNPPESFSYSFAKDTSTDDHVIQEADITPQTIDGRYRDAGQEHATPFQAAHSESPAWRGALAHLTAISGMSSAVAIVNHNSAMKREPDSGLVNGYNTIHYSIDTARFDATERHMLLSSGDSEKGDAWVTSEGCPVKLDLDSELHRSNGSLI
ncbi:MAG: hypothetical protein WA485_20295, partial [Candidatus Sulfotelmatobacter sp.]